MKRDKMKQATKKPTTPIRKSGGGGKKPVLRRTRRSKEGKELLVLILEDNPADAELIERQLKKAGIDFVSRRTDTRSGYLHALKSFKPDLILADYSLPGFDGLQALKLCKKRAPLTPFIIFTGSISEEAAVECMKQGADDYVLKDRLTRLPEATRRSLEKRRLQEERARAEAALQAAASRWDTTFNSMADAVCLLDENGLVLQYNQAMNRLLKLSSEAIVGRDCLSLICGQRKKNSCAFQSMQRTRRREEEKTFWRGRWFQVAVDPIIGSGGKVSGAVHVMTDITRQKETEEKLRFSEERYRQVFDHAGIGIGYYSPSGRLLLFNQQAVRNMGGQPVDFVGKNLKELYPGALGNLIRKRIRVACKNETTKEYEDFVHLPTGDKCFLSHYTPIHESRERVAGVQIISHDITERKLMQDTIANSAKEWITTVDAISDPIVLLDRNGVIQRCNRAFSALTGKPFNEIIGRPLQVLLLGENVAEHYPNLRLALRSRSPLRAEAGIAGRHFDITFFPILDGQGRIQGQVHTLKDVSDRQRAESQREAALDALRESEERFRTLTEKSPFGVVLFELSGRWQYVNPRFTELTGYELADISYGRIWFAKAFPDEDYRRQVVADWKRDLTDIIAGMSQKRQYRVHTKNCGYRYFSIVSTKFEAARAILVIDDITEGRRAEEALRESEKKYRELADLLPQPVFEADLQGRLTYVNRTAYEAFGYGDNDFRSGLQIWQMLIPEDRKRAAENVSRVIAGEPSGGSEYIARRKDGTVFPALLFSTPILKEGGPLGIRGILIDITERKHAEEQIRASLLEKEVLLKEIHHRVKNNLQVISGLLTLQAAQMEDERLQQLIKESQSRIWTMALIHQMLYQSGDLTDIDMADYIRSLVSNLLSSYVPSAGPPALQFDLAPVRLVIDKAIPLALIINELVTNSMKHAFPAGRLGKICITLHKCRDKACPRQGTRLVPTDKDHASMDHENTLTYELTVADDGVGLPEGFDLKNQKSLGLQLVVMLVNQLGGSLAVASSGGTSVHIIFSNNEKIENQS